MSNNQSSNTVLPDGAVYKRPLVVNDNHNNFIEEQQPLSWRHLFKYPVVRQYLGGGVLAREVEERGVARSELFFDLVFVGM